MNLKGITYEEAFEIFGKGEGEYHKLWWKGSKGTICNGSEYKFPRSNIAINVEWFVEENKSANVL